MAMTSVSLPWGYYMIIILVQTSDLLKNKTEIRDTEHTINKKSFKLQL